MEPEPTVVWMVSARTGPNGLKGSLALEHDRVVFTATGGSTRTFLLQDVRRVRRALMTPVLELRMTRGSDPKVVGFYFVRPPPLDPDAARVMRKRQARRQAANQLMSSNATKKDEVVRWVNAIRAVKGG